MRSTTADSPSALTMLPLKRSLPVINAERRPELGARDAGKDIIIPADDELSFGRLPFHQAQLLDHPLDEFIVERAFFSVRTILIVRHHRRGDIFHFSAVNSFSQTSEGFLRPFRAEVLVAFRHKILLRNRRFFYRHDNSITSRSTSLVGRYEFPDDKCHVYDINHSLRKSQILLPVLILFAASLTGCNLRTQSPPSGLIPWMFSDVRVIDAPDASSPATDLIAGYARRMGEQVQVRLDFLDADILPDYDLYLAIDDFPGGSRSLPGIVPTDISWDRLIYMPAQGGIIVFNQDLEPVVDKNVLAMRKPDLDYVEVGINAPAPDKLSFQAFSHLCQKALHRRQHGRLQPGRPPSCSQPNPARLLEHFARLFACSGVAPLGRRAYRSPGRAAWAG